MRHVLLTAGLVAVMASASAAQARSGCEAYAHNRKVTGTVVGALGGGLLGAAVAGHGEKGTGALVGAGLGAVVGNQVSRVHCRGGYAVRYRRHRYASAHTAPTTAAYSRYAANTAPSCHYVSRPYYDAAGRVIYAPMQVCD